MSHGTLSASQSQTQLSAPPMSIWVGLLGILCAAMAGGMAWGIRGQFGHELGAMMFGIIAGFTLVMLFLPNASSLQAARVVALFTVAVGFGGSMSYGETVGLTHDHELHRVEVVNEAGETTFVKQRNWPAYWWGMLGLAVKGGLWIGFAGALLGVGMGGKKYIPLEMLGLGLGMLVVIALGMWLLNSPFDPVYEEISLESGETKSVLSQEASSLPTIYFSDHWDWEPVEQLKPRPENWGGMLFAFVGLVSYLQFIKDDKLARNMAVWGLIGGLGFPIGQSVQASYGFDAEAFRSYFPIVYGTNSWNMMEVTFGLVAGLALGMGLWFNRKKIVEETSKYDVSLSVGWEAWLLAAYMYLLIAGWYFEDSIFGYFHEYGHLMGVIPLVAIIGGRYWPYLYAFPIVAMPIAVKTFRNVSLRSENISLNVGWICIVTIPLLIMILAALYFGKRTEQGDRARPFTCIGLLLTSALYFWLNFFFYSPPPWQWFKGWDFQSHSGMIYIVAWLVLSLAALIFMKLPKTEKG